MTKQSREGEENSPRGPRPAKASRADPNWAEFVRLAHQAVAAIGGAGIINRAKSRACGLSRRTRPLDTEPRKKKEGQARRQTKSERISEGRRVTRRGFQPYGLCGAPHNTGENSPSGMIRGGGGNVSMIWRPFATMLERADTLEAAGLNWARLCSTRPVFPAWRRTQFRKTSALFSVHAQAPRLPRSAALGQRR